MAFKRNFKRKYRRQRRAMKGKFKKNKRYAMMPLKGTYLNNKYFMPPMYFNKMRYGTCVQCLAGTGNSHIELVFSQNDCYRPYKAVSTGFSAGFMSGYNESVNGFADMDGVYEYWCVFGSKIKARVVSEGTTAALGNAIVFIRPADSATVQTYQQNCNRLNANSSSRGLLQFGGNNTCTVSNYNSSRQTFGSNVFKTDIDYEGQGSTGPTKQRYWHVTVMPSAVQAGSNTPPCFIEIEITYFVRWRQLNTDVPV